MRSLLALGLGSFLSAATLAAGCAGGTPETPTPAPDGVDYRAWEFFYRTAAEDLRCNQTAIEVRHIATATYEAKGCGGVVAYGVFYENSSGPKLISDAAVRENAATLISGCDEEPVIVAPDDETRSVRACGRQATATWNGQAWEVRH